MFGLDLITLPLAGTPFGTALEVCLVTAFVAWLLSVITREVSWIDRLWSICPPVYCLIVALATDFQFARVNVMTLLVVLWGARLTWNFARKGGYRPGGEDYRWATVREKAGPVGFQVLNITFVHPGQMVLIWLFTSPIHRAWAFGDLPLNRLDFVAAGLFFLLLVGQTIADNQQWSFQQDKKRRIAAGEDVEHPFLTTGLFRYSRHPNYFCEIAMWCVFYLFAVAASGEWLHWTGLGCIGLILLFIPSLRMTEQLSAARYPTYRDYQATTSALIPLPPRGAEETSFRTTQSLFAEPLVLRSGAAGDPFDQAFHRCFLKLGEGYTLLRALRLTGFLQPVGTLEEVPHLVVTVAPRSAGFVAGNGASSDWVPT